MKMVFTKKLFVLVVLLVTSYGIRANPISGKEKEAEANQGVVLKEYRFSQFQTMDTTQIDKALVPQHYLGDEVAVLYYVFKRTYLSEEMDYSRAASTQTVQKPAIYNSVVQMNKLLKKTVKKGDYSKEQAARILKDCLQKSYAAFFVNTSDLETQLSEIDGLEQYIALYQNISFE